VSERWKGFSMSALPVGFHYLLFSYNGGEYWTECSYDSDKPDVIYCHASERELHTEVADGWMPLPTKDAAEAWGAAQGEQE